MAGDPLPPCRSQHKQQAGGYQDAFDPPPALVPGSASADDTSDCRVPQMLSYQRGEGWQRESHPEGEQCRAQTCSNEAAQNQQLSPTAQPVYRNW
jgi:hypothetical protein